MCAMDLEHLDAGLVGAAGGVGPALDQRLHLGALGKNCRTECGIRLGVFCVSENYVP